MRKERPKRTPPGGSLSSYGPVDTKARSEAIKAEEADEQAFFFRCYKLFGDKGFSFEPSPAFIRSMDILWRLYYEFQRLSYNNKDAGDAAIRRFLMYY